MPSAASPPLRLLFWESTMRCNLACQHCRRIETAEEAAKQDLTTAEFRRVLDSTASLGKPIIVFSGGEPLMRDDWEILAAHAQQLGLPTALATNGTLVDAAVAKRIAQAGFRRVSISLDGADAATHDEFRRVAGLVRSGARTASPTCGPSTCPSRSTRPSPPTTPTSSTTSTR